MNVTPSCLRLCLCVVGACVSCARTRATSSRTCTHALPWPSSRQRFMITTVTISTVIVAIINNIVDFRLLIPVAHCPKRAHPGNTPNKPLTSLTLHTDESAAIFTRREHREVRHATTPHELLFANCHIRFPAYSTGYSNDRTTRHKQQYQQQLGHAPQKFAARPAPRPPDHTITATIYE